MEQTNKPSSIYTQKQTERTPKEQPDASKVPMQFMPLDDRLIVQTDTPEQITSAGIIIPDTIGNASKSPTTGIVIAVGPGRLMEGSFNSTIITNENCPGRLQTESRVEPITLSVVPGDRILWSKFAGTIIQIDGSDFTIIRESDIIGVFK